MNTPPKVLIATIQPAGGGVPAMVRAVVDCLRQRNYQVTLAYYEPYSVSPECSLPLYKLPQFLAGARPMSKQNQYYNCDAVGVGCYLPELENRHYAPSTHWLSLINSHDFHLVVSGSCLAARPFVETATPFLAWVASDWLGDREHRVKTFSWFRKALDFALVRPLCSRLERKIIQSDSLVALSEHSQSALNQRVATDAVAQVLSMPIDTDLFTPNITKPRKGKKRLGFIGRFEDPRKNISLLIDSLPLLVNKDPTIELILVGDTLSDEHVTLARELSVLDKIVVHPYLHGDDLLEQIRALDVFVIPSHQEGLCIAALEAMSCEVPVISTPCGGPETFIKSGDNGLITPPTPSAMVAAILQLLSDEKQRLSYAKRARQTIVERFSKQAQAQQFWALFDRKFGS